jgi:glycerol kinase
MRTAGIDQGTSSTRVLVASDNGTSEIKHSTRHTQRRPQPGWVEHDAGELLANVRRCAEVARHNSGGLDAIGIANQGESCLAWDAANGEPISPVIVWQDHRTADIIERLRAEECDDLTRSRAGLPLDTYFSASKLGWILKNIPEAAQRMRRGRLRLGTTDAYFLDRLTGVFATDVTTASRTSLMNLQTRQWDDELCRLFGVPIESLPEIRPTVGSFGSLDGVPATAAIVDQQAALYGHGCRRAGDAKITFGTGAFMLAVTGATVVRSHERGLLPTIAWQIRNEEIVFAVDGGLHDAGAVIEWIHRLGLFKDFAELTEFEAAPAISRGLVFVPALTGLACPHWDSKAGGTWIGMTAQTSRRDLCQAALEGIALGVADVVSEMSRSIAIADRLSVDGGLAASRYFLQFLADVTRRSVLRQPLTELTAHGCAVLAAVGIGREMPPPQAPATIFAPRRVDDAAWRERYAMAVSRAMHWH